MSADYIIFGKEGIELVLEERELLEACRAAELEDKNAVRKQLDLPKFMQSSKVSDELFGYNNDCYTLLCLLLLHITYTIENVS